LADQVELSEGRFEQGHETGLWVVNRCGVPLPEAL